MATIDRTGNDYANNLIPCAAGIGAGDGDQERLSLYVTVRIGEIEKTTSEIPRGWVQGSIQREIRTRRGFIGWIPLNKK